MEYLQKCRYEIKAGKGKDHFSSVFSPCHYTLFTHDVKSNSSFYPLHNVKDVLFYIHERTADGSVSKVPSE
jgi:hypothetical protein